MICSVAAGSTVYCRWMVTCIVSLWCAATVLQAITCGCSVAGCIPVICHAKSKWFLCRNISWQALLKVITRVASLVCQKLYDCVLMYLHSCIKTCALSRPYHMVPLCGDSHILLFCSCVQFQLFSFLTAKHQDGNIDSEPR